MLSSGFKDWSTQQLHTQFWLKEQSWKSHMQYWDCLPHNWDELP
jgi:hypothetical protein